MHAPSIFLRLYRCTFLSSRLLPDRVPTLAGEIIPQAACKSYGLAIGAYSAPIVRLIIFLEYIIAKPISMVLDWALGDDHGVGDSFQCGIA